MYPNLKILAQQITGSTSEDTDEAFNILYEADPDGTWSVTLDATNLTLVGGGVTTVLTRASYATNLLLKTAVEAISGWKLFICSLGADDPRSARLITFTVTAGTKAGIRVLWDTSAVDFRVRTIGRETFIRDYAAASSSGGNIPYQRDPVLNNIGPGGQGVTYADRVTNQLLIATGVATGTGPFTWQITPCSPTADGQTISFPAGATTVQNTLGASILGDLGIVGNPGERIVCKLVSAANDMSASTISLVGNICDGG